MTAAASAAGADVERYRRELESLRPGPAWLVERRRAAFERFADRGFPTTRDEEWRQTNVARIAGTAFGPAADGGGGDDLRLPPALAGWEGAAAVFVDGRFSPELSRAGQGSSGVEVSSLRHLLERAPSRVEPLLAARPDERGSAFADLNAALHQDGAVVFVAPGAVVPDPIHLVHVFTGKAVGAVAFHPRSLVLAGKGSEARVVESYAGPDGAIYLTNAVTQIRLEEGASLRHYRLQREGDAAFHVGRLAVLLGRNSRFHDHSFSFGASLARHDVDVVLRGEGSECSLEGLFFAAGDRHTDVHTRIDHVAPHGTSRELYKGILDGKGRGVFHGLVIVRPGAQKTDAIQSNRNLLLSREALVSSTPQLEILADDVKCKHGSTTGQLDPVAVFYLRSRGIGEEQARRLLTRAFAAELVQRIDVPPLRAICERELDARLGGGTGDEEAAA